MSNRSSKKKRFFLGVGVGEYDDETLNLDEAVGDVQKIGTWFTQKSKVEHEWAVPELGENPTVNQIRNGLREFFLERQPEDVVVLYFACHGEVEGGVPYLFGRDTPSNGLAGAALNVDDLGAILGQSALHNILVIIDTCVAGALGSEFQTKAQIVATELAKRDPRRRFEQVFWMSTFDRSVALDGKFAKAFLTVAEMESVTGTTEQWINTDHFFEELSSELHKISPTQIPYRSSSGTGKADFIPNPQFGQRPLGGLLSEDVEGHFAPMARAALGGESQDFFVGRKQELEKIDKWGSEELESDQGILVVTGSPGSGKSSLVAHAASRGGFDGAVWCRNKDERQVIKEIGNILGGRAVNTEMLLQLAREK